MFEEVGLASGSSGLDFAVDPDYGPDPEFLDCPAPL